MATKYETNNCKLISTVVLFLLLDFITSNVLFFHGIKFSRFQTEIFAFQFGESTFDLWVLAMFRICLLLGAVVGLLHRKKDAASRLSSTVRPIFYLAAAMTIYVVVKLLVSSESHLEEDTKIWFWSLSGFSILGSCILIFCWYLLSKITTPSSLSTEEEVGNVLERERLLTSDSEEENGPKDKKKHKKKKKEPKIENATASTWKLLSYSKPDIGYLCLAFLFLFAACGAQIFLPYYTGQVIDGIAIEKNKKKFEMAILYMGLISLGEAICAGLRGGIFQFVCARFNIRVNNNLFGSIVNQDIGFFDKTKTGEIISRLTSDTTKMSDQVTYNVNIFLRNVVLGIGVCIFMFKLSWQLSVVTLIGLPLVAIVSEIYGDYYKKLSTAVQDCVAKTNEVAAEVVSSMKTVRSFANEDGELKRYKRKNKKVFKLKIKEALALGGYNSCAELLFLATEVAILYYGGHLVMKGYLTGGNLVSFILYQLELTNCLEEIGDVYTGLMEAVGAAEKVFKLIDRKPAIINDGKIEPASCRGSVEFRNVSFSYPSRPEVPILDNVSFQVRPGQVVALVGPSGGGKSTCINLLEHFYEPSSGEVCIDSIPVQELHHKYLHNVTSLVGQEPVLFARSITKNIGYGMELPDNDMQKIEHAALLANAHNFIKEMPEAYQTETGEKGLQLSGGQKQRIAIARSLIRNPKILLLDEATSALDAESEHLVQDAMYKNLQGHTVLIIAHRLSTIEKADLIIFIEKGRVAEQGTHLELIARDGLYNKLVQRQMLGADKASDEGEVQEALRTRDGHRKDSSSSSSSSSGSSYSNSHKRTKGGYSVSPPKL